MRSTKLHKFDIRIWFVILFISLPLIFAEVQAEVINTYETAINKAGRQRMLSQRIVKAYSMVGLDVQADAANEQLLLSVELFEKQLSELKRFSKNKSTKRSLAKVETLWIPFRNVALGNVSKEGVKKLLAKDNALLKATHEVVLTLQKSANSKLGKIVNTSGRQRMLSQRIAKYYMLAAWGVNTEQSYKLMQISGNKFSSALNKLSSSKMNTKKISTSLEETKTQWSIFERSFRMKKGRFIPLLIAMSSEKILVSMNEVTGLYDELGK
ncbi:MAG: type IV pili methyl-accepting chemotaxis transducer N-terminal domain-containing protein [Gammaproteobacteria bacterium]|nr:type IV pili methyl-accepting chemotaxis transducer N-terminal domain-containing protein [Gammaproteobacteria bacterium]